MSTSIKQLSSAKLVDQCIALDRELKTMKRNLDSYKAELQSRGAAVMDDRNQKYAKFYGKSGSVSVNDAMKLTILNAEKLQEGIGEGIFAHGITRTEKVEYKPNSKLEKALKAIFMGDYTFEYTLDEFLEKLPPMDSKQKLLLRKKLKGEYEKDKATLLTVLGYIKEGEDADKAKAPDFDVELFYIYKIKNAELIRAYLPEDGIDQTIRDICQSILVECSTGLTINYEEEEV